MMKKIRLGTRGSPLALRQTSMVREALLTADPSLDIEVVVVLTSGDWKPAHGEVPLKADAGGKALFAKEIQERLLVGEIDAAIHSMKDMESFMLDDLVIPWMLPREDPRDALIVTDGNAKNVSLDDLPHAAKVGTTSLRRQAFLLAKRPDLQIQPLRGNVQTRIDKIRAGQVDASFLAIAGLKRLGLEHEVAGVLSVDDMLPAAAQGAVGIEVRKDRMTELSVFDQINCINTNICVTAERSVLRALEGSCHTPAGAYAQIINDQIYLKGCVIMPDGSDVFFAEEKNIDCTLEAVKEAGVRVGLSIKERVPAGVL